MKFLPKSILGIISLGLGVVFTVMLVLKLNGVAAMSAPTIFGALITGFLLGLVAWLRKDRAWSLLIFVVPAGLFAILWSVAELVFPH